MVINAVQKDKAGEKDSKIRGITLEKLYFDISKTFSSSCVTYFRTRQWNMNYWCDTSWLTSLGLTSNSGRSHRLVEEYASNCFWLSPDPHQYLWFWQRCLEGTLPNMRCQKPIKNNQTKPRENQKKAKWGSEGLWKSTPL